MIREPLKKEEIIKVIERKGCDKIPLLMHKWWGAGLEKKLGSSLYEIANKYPDDFFIAWYEAPGTIESPNKNPSYRWGYKQDYSDAVRHSIGETYELLPDWSELNQFLMDFPDPNESGTFNDVEIQLKNAGERYKIGAFWRLFHEKLWSIRGMENLMVDYYDNMDELKIVGNKLLEFHKTIVDRYAKLGFDGIFTSDDLGHQTGPMMSPAIFEDLYFPLYKDFISYVHSKGMHVFLHSCGDNTKLMEYLIEAGLDVFHPIQKGCMDTKETAAKYGDRITFLAGVDVQHLIPNGTVTEVMDGIQQLIDTLHKPEGGLLLACGNGILIDTPIENIEAMLNAMTKNK